MASRLFVSRSAAALVFASFTTAAAPSVSVSEVVEAERSFARMAQEKGITPAFRTFIADKGVIFGPDPQLGKPQLLSRPDQPGSLKWWPIYAGIAASGDLGFTTGPYVLDAGDRKGYGHYFTVWQKQPDGSWRWLLDHGPQTGEAAPEGPEAPVAALPVGQVRKGASATSAWTEVLAAEAALAKGLATDAKAALLGVMSDDARLMRTGSQPAMGRAAYTPALGKGPQTLVVHNLGGLASQAGDLAYTYGDAKWQRDGKDRRGHYVRIWQRRGDGWKVVVDELIPVPPPPPAAPKPSN